MGLGLAVAFFAGNTARAATIPLGIMGTTGWLEPPSAVEPLGGRLRGFQRATEWLYIYHQDGTFHHNSKSYRPN